MELTVATESAMEALGGRFAAALPPDQACIIYLQGDLGAGKTTLCRGLLRALGHRAGVKSPTYTLVESYAVAGRQLHHFDLYRLADPEELEYMGVRDYFTGTAVCLIEWPERGATILPGADIAVHIEHSQTARHVVARACTEDGEQLLKRIALLSESA